MPFVCASVTACFHSHEDIALNLQSYTESITLFYHKSRKPRHRQERNSSFHDAMSAGVYPAFLLFFAYFVLRVLCAFVSLFCYQCPEDQTSSPDQQIIQVQKAYCLQSAEEKFSVSRPGVFKSLSS